MDFQDEQVIQLFTAFLTVNITAVVSGLIVVYSVGVLEGLVTTILILVILPAVINYRILKG